MEAAAKSKTKAVEIMIDDEPFTAPAKEMPARAIIELAGVNPVNHYLKELKAKREQISYKDCPDEVIKLHKGSTFVTVPTGDTGVS